MAKSSAQRRAEADARKRAAGLVRVSVWVPRDCVEQLKLDASILRALGKEKPQGPEADGVDLTSQSD